ncbi:MAG: hypothetical protein JXN61_12880 [Sedimentisphaerales bacterium]|nr:hypothetical protein [Sedimentisphaerales bacterium]
MQNDRNLSRRAERTGSVLLVGLLILLIVGMLYWDGKIRNVSRYIYVRGWLGLDKLVEGEVILTSDEENFYLYTWKGKAEPARFPMLTGGL